MLAPPLLQEIEMPSKSKAQFGKMGILYRQGKISRKTLEDFNKGVDVSKLPEHVKKKKRGVISRTLVNRRRSR